MKSVSKLLLAAVFGLSVLGSVVANAEKTEPHDVQSARTLAKAWDEYRSGFTQLRCEYRKQQGTAESWEAALRGEIQEPFSADVLWLLDGDQERCSVMAADDPRSEISPETSQASGNAEYGIMALPGISSSHFLKGDGIRGHASGDCYVLSLIGPESPATADLDVTPFSLGIMGPGGTRSPLVFLEEYADGGMGVRSGSDTGVDGQPVLFIELSDPRPGTIRYEFDPAKGMMLVRYRADIPGQRIECRVTEAQETTAGWFPMHAVRVLESRGIISVRTFDVQELNVGPIADPSEFAIAFPAAAYVNGADPGGQFQLRSARTVSPADLAGLWQQTETMRARLELPYLQAGGKNRIWWTTLNILLASAGVIAYSWHRRRKRATAES